MLDEFSSAKIEDKQDVLKPTTTPAAVTETEQEAGGEEDDFAKELQAGMAELLGQFQNNPEMQQEFEQMMTGLGQAAATTNGPLAASATAKPQSKSGDSKLAAASKSGEESFQETIRKTMERMQNSGETASAAAASSSEEDMLAKMLKEMESGNFAGLDGGNEEDFNKMLMGMMEHLTNKDMLHEPMKELQDKFPNWLESHKGTVSAEDLARYKEQQATVGRIVARFERAGYSDSKKEDREYIVDQMQKVTSLGLHVHLSYANAVFRCKPLVHLRRTWLEIWAPRKKCSQTWMADVLSNKFHMTSLWRTQWQ